MEKNQLFSFTTDNNYEYLLSNNLSILFFQKKKIVFLINHFGVFIFLGNRCINDAFNFYYLKEDLYINPIQYYRFKQKEKDEKSDYEFISSNKTYSIKLFNHGIIEEDFSFTKLNRKFLYLNILCNDMKKNKINLSNYNKQIAVIEGVGDSEVEFMDVDDFKYDKITFKYKSFSKLQFLLDKNKTKYEEAFLGIFLIDAFKFENKLSNLRSGCFIFYCIEGTLRIKYFEELSVNELIEVIAYMIDDNLLPSSIKTNSVYLYDLLLKSFIDHVEFVLTSESKDLIFITEVAKSLTRKMFDCLSIKYLCEVVENTYNVYKKLIKAQEIKMFEQMLSEIVASFSLEAFNIDNNIKEDLEIDEVDNNDDHKNVLLS